MGTGLLAGEPVRKFFFWERGHGADERAGTYEGAMRLRVHSNAVACNDGYVPMQKGWGRVLIR
eukprot:2502981-Prymnesium_polylepis.1